MSDSRDFDGDRLTNTSPQDRAKHVWSIGSYSSIAPTFLGMAAHLVRTADVQPDDRVLDVACGTGNVAITAARGGGRVTGIDITPSMLDAARENAAVAGVQHVTWREGDAAALPIEDDAFDVTLSCVGHVFAEPPDAVARELVRVTRPGGTLAFTSWTPDSVVPAMGNAVKAYLPPDPNPAPPPVTWGDPRVVRERLDDLVIDLEFETGTVLSHVVSPAHYWRDATADSGMFIVAIETVAEDDRPAVRADVLAAVDRYFDDDENAVRMEYRVTTATVAG